jgi:hypothetical protein
MTLYDSDVREDDQAKYRYAVAMECVLGLEHRIDGLLSDGAIDSATHEQMSNWLSDIGSVVNLATVYWLCNSPTYSDGSAVVSRDRHVAGTEGGGAAESRPKGTTGEAEDDEYDTLYEAISSLTEPSDGVSIRIFDPPKWSRPEDDGDLIAMLRAKHASSQLDRVLMTTADTADSNTDNP